MTENPTTPRTAVNRFWDRFIDRARKKRGKEPAIRWHVRRAEQYLKAFAGKRLAEHSVQDVTGYLEGVGRIGRIKDGQRRRTDARRAIRHSAGHPCRRILPTDARPTGRHRGPGKWRNRYRVPPYWIGSVRAPRFT